MDIQALTVRPVIQTSADPYTRPANMSVFDFLTMRTVPSQWTSTKYVLHCDECAGKFYTEVVNVASLKLSATFARRSFPLDGKLECYTQAEFDEAVQRGIALFTDAAN